MGGGENENVVAGTDIEQVHGRVAEPHNIAEFLALFGINCLAVQECLVTRGWQIRFQPGTRVSLFVAPTEKQSESHIHSIDFRGERSQLRALLGTLPYNTPDSLR
jgi:hypothetical protein